VIESGHCPFEIGLSSGKEGGMAVSAVWRRVYFLAPLTIGTKRVAPSTQPVPPDRRVYESVRRVVPLY